MLTTPVLTILCGIISLVSSTIHTNNKPRTPLRKLLMQSEDSELNDAALAFLFKKKSGGPLGLWETRMGIFKGAYLHWADKDTFLLDSNFAKNYKGTLFLKSLTCSDPNIEVADSNGLIIRKGWESKGDSGPKLRETFEMRNIEMFHGGNGKDEICNVAQLHGAMLHAVKQADTNDLEGYRTKERRVELFRQHLQEAANAHFVRTGGCKFIADITPPHRRGGTFTCMFYPKGARFSGSTTPRLFIFGDADLYLIQKEHPIYSITRDKYGFLLIGRNPFQDYCFSNIRSNWDICQQIQGAGIPVTAGKNSG